MEFKEQQHKEALPTGFLVIYFVFLTKLAANYRLVLASVLLH